MPYFNQISTPLNTYERSAVLCVFALSRAPRELLFIELMCDTRWPGQNDREESSISFSFFLFSFGFTCLSCGMQALSCSMWDRVPWPGDWTCVPGIGSMESYPPNQSNFLDFVLFIITLFIYYCGCPPQHLSLLGSLPCPSRYLWRDKYGNFIGFPEERVIYKILMTQTQLRKQQPYVSLSILLLQLSR